jgi:hypothetical protein
LEKVAAIRICLPLRRDFLGAFNITLLPGFVTAAEEHEKLTASVHAVNPIARAIVYSHLVDPLP